MRDQGTGSQHCGGDLQNEEELRLFFRSQPLAQDSGGRACWRATEMPRVLRACETAILICDMWDQHWSRGASERVNEMAPRMDGLIAAARAQGVHIIHAPSDTLSAYAGTPARQRMLEHTDPPLSNGALGSRRGPGP